MDQLRDASLLRMLAARGIELIAAVRPDENAGPLVHACREHGVPLFLWPMLQDEDGRWANTRNADAFAEFVDALLKDLGKDALPNGLALDLEPPIDDMRATLAAGFRRLLQPRPPYPSHASPFSGASDLGLETLVAMVPLVLADSVVGRGWQSWLGTPMTRIEADAFSPMIYSSLAVGYSKGSLRRADVRGLVYACARACRRTFGSRASASLGAVGTGALGDERVFDGVSDLAEDVALCGAAGIKDIALFDLGGVLRRPPAERWLDALVSTPAAISPPSLTARARLAVALASGTSALLR